MANKDLATRVLHHLDDEDELFDQLEREAEDSAQYDQFREQRMQQLKQEYQRVHDMQQSQHGTYTQIRDEKELLDLTTKTHRCIVHFFHKDFRRCQIMDQHLESLVKRHFATRFVKVNVEDVPFLVTRLHIQVLPCVLSFVDGVTKDRLIGFEELGNADDFRTITLERRLVKAGVLDPPTTSAAPNDGSILKYAAKAADEDADEYE
ncbi:hypothetical protein RI367_001503 [Sorochytrium milnesiophthora]